MNRKKLGTCVVAALISVGGSMFLATPAQASMSDGACSATEQAWADGYTEAKCEDAGDEAGFAANCVHHDVGPITYVKICIPFPY